MVRVTTLFSSRSRSSVGDELFLGVAIGRSGGLLLAATFPLSDRSTFGSRHLLDHRLGDGLEDVGAGLPLGDAELLRDLLAEDPVNDGVRVTTLCSIAEGFGGGLPSAQGGTVRATVALGPGRGQERFHLLHGVVELLTSGHDQAVFQSSPGPTCRCGRVGLDDQAPLHHAEHGRLSLELPPSPTDGRARGVEIQSEQFQHTGDGGAGLSGHDVAGVHRLCGFVSEADDLELDVAGKFIHRTHLGLELRNTVHIREDDFRSASFPEASLARNRCQHLSVAALGGVLFVPLHGGIWLPTASLLEQRRQALGVLDASGPDDHPLVVRVPDHVGNVSDHHVLLASLDLFGIETTESVGVHDHRGPPVQDRFGHQPDSERHELVAPASFQGFGVQIPEEEVVQGLTGAEATATVRHDGRDDAVGLSFAGSGDAGAQSQEAHFMAFFRDRELPDDGGLVPVVVHSLHCTLVIEPGHTVLIHVHLDLGSEVLPLTRTEGELGEVGVVALLVHDEVGLERRLDLLADDLPEQPASGVLQHPVLGVEGGVAVFGHDRLAHHPRHQLVGAGEGVIEVVQLLGVPHVHLPSTQRAEAGAAFTLGTIRSQRGHDGVELDLVVFLARRDLDLPDRVPEELLVHVDDHLDGCVSHRGEPDAGVDDDEGSALRGIGHGALQSRGNRDEVVVGKERSAHVRFALQEKNAGFHQRGKIPGFLHFVNISGQNCCFLSTQRGCCRVIQLL